MNGFEMHVEPFAITFFLFQSMVMNSRKCRDTFFLRGLGVGGGITTAKENKNIFAVGEILCAA